MKPRTFADIVAIDDTLEALAVRFALEWWGVQVTLHLVGEAKDVVRILGGEEEISKNVILMCHGNDKGLVLPELHPSIEEKQPYHGALTPTDLKEFLHLPDCIVLNTGCSLGTPEFADAFLQAGCQAYIAPLGDPEGTASLFYVLYFYYEWICRGNDMKKAHERVSSHDEETRMFKLYESVKGEKQ